MIPFFRLSENFEKNLKLKQKLDNMKNLKKKIIKKHKKRLTKW